MGRPPSEVSARGEARDREWEAFVREVRRGGARDFGDHWSTFQRLERGRDPADGPLRVWRPDDATVTASNLRSLASEAGASDVPSLHAWSIARRDAFWSTVRDRLGIRMHRPPRAPFAPGSTPEEDRWFPDARLNVAESCFQAPAEATAIVFRETDGAPLIRVTTTGLRRLADRFARGLHAAGFLPGDAIALYMPMTPECVAAYLGIVLAGCAVVSVADSFSPNELRRRLDLAEARTVVTVDRFLRAGKTIDLLAKVREARIGRAIVIAGAGPSAVSFRRGESDWRDFLGDDAPFDAVIAGPDDATNVLFSSGTTATPKAIPWTHLTPVKSAMDAHYHHDVHPGDVVCWPTNVGWMMGPWLIYAALVNRATIALYGDAPTDAGFPRFVRDAGVTMLGVVPSLVRAWRDTGALDGVDWPSLRTFASTGEASNQEDALWLMSRTGYRAPILEYCGGTEIGGGYLTGTVLQPASPATFTTPALGLDVVVLGEDGRPVAPGQSGELFLVPPSIGLSRRLIHRDHHEVYHAGCPPGPRGERLRRHGDTMRVLHGGFFRAGGRADDAMNLGGIKVASLEIERVLSTHPIVRECAAVGVPPEEGGAERLVVFAVLDPPGAPVPNALRKELDRLLAHDLNPLFRLHALESIDALPRTASNKVMRRELRARWANAAASRTDPSPGT